MIDTDRDDVCVADDKLSLALVVRESQRSGDDHSQLFFRVAMARDLEIGLEVTSTAIAALPAIA